MKTTTYFIGWLMSITTVTINEYAKDVLDSILVAVEGCASKLHTSAHVGINPFAVYLRK